MWMRFRHMENFRSFRRIWELTYYPQVVIRSMDQKELDSCTSTARQSAASHSRRRPAERHAFRNRQRTGNRRTWRCSEDDVPDFDEKAEHLYQLKERMAEGLSKMNDVVINGMPVREGAPHILSVSFLGIRSEVLLTH